LPICQPKLNIITMGNPDGDAINQAAGQIVVLDAKLALANGGRRPLEFYRRAGEMIAKLPGGYDSSRIGELAKALKKQKAPGTGANNLYKMARFAAVTPADQVRILDQQRVSWRAASGLTTKNLPKAKREDFIRRLSSGKLKAEKLGGQMLSALPPSARATTLSVEKAYARAEQAVKQLLEAETLGNRLAGQKLKELRSLLKRTA
jgi:hypothetical protein